MTGIRTHWLEWLTEISDRSDVLNLHPQQILTLTEMVGNQSQKWWENQQSPVVRNIGGNLGEPPKVPAQQICNYSDRHGVVSWIIIGMIGSFIDRTDRSQLNQILMWQPVVFDFRGMSSRDPREFEMTLLLLKELHKLSCLFLRFVTIDSPSWLCRYVLSKQ